jgi:UDP-glucose 4-epimerase
MVPLVGSELDTLLDALAGETIFITGGAGFIGSTLAGELLARSNVVVFDNFARDALSGKDYADSPNLRVLHGDVLDAPSVRDAMRGATHVVHCAGITGIDTVVTRPVDTIRVNAVGSANVLQAASELGNIRRVTCFSTSEVFGQLAFRSEETSPAVLGAVGEARWTYAVSKLVEEHLAYAYFKQHALPTVSVRPFNVYGPGQVGEGAMRAFILRALEGEDLIIHGEGAQIRAWCYIDDMIEGILRTLVLDGAVGESFNIGNQRAVVSVYGLASTIVRVLQSSSEIRFVPRASADIDLRIPSIEKARDVLGFEAKVDLEDGIRRTAEYFMAHHV